MESSSEKKKSVDGIKPAEKKPAGPLKAKMQPTGSKEPLVCDVMDYKVPKRGVWWHIVFFLVFIISGGLSIYFMDWALLFFIVVFAGYTLFRGAHGTTFKLSVDKDGIKINNKFFAFGSIESFYLSESGDSNTVTFQFIKKIYPRLTFLILDRKNTEALRSDLGEKVPETEYREEKFSDFFVRVLKL